MIRFPPPLFARRAGAIAALCVLAILGPTAAAQAPHGVETFDAAWTIVRDSHFDERMNGVDWPAVAAELRPRAAAAKDAAELRRVLREMLNRLGQSHFAVIPSTADGPPGSRGDQTGSPGLDVRLVDGALVVTGVEPDGPAAAAGVRAGWVVEQVAGAPMQELLGTLSEGLEPRLLRVEAWRLAQGRLRGPSHSTVGIGFVDGDGRSVQLTLERRPEAGEPVTIGNLPTMFVRVSSRGVTTPGGRPTGVIGFNVWMAAVDRLFQQAIDEHRGAAAIVLDLRGNPGGLAAMLMGLSGHFIDERQVLGVMRTRGNGELRFVVNPRRVNARGERVAPFAGPVAILVDALTGSASECFAGGMQAVGRTRVFGETTMGQALPALFSTLPNGDVLIHAYADFLTADGTRLEGRGVVPDHPVPTTRADLLAGRDVVLDAALAWVDAQIAGQTASTSRADVQLLR